MDTFVETMSEKKREESAKIFVKDLEAMRKYVIFAVAYNKHKGALAQTKCPCCKSGKFAIKKKDMQSEWVHSLYRVWIPLSLFSFS